MTFGTENSNNANSRGKGLSWIAAGLGWRLRAWLGKAREARWAAGNAVRHALGFEVAEPSLIQDSQIYWNDSPDRSLKQNSHWRGVGIFQDDERWLSLGSGHLQMYQEFAQSLRTRAPLRRIVEWGCGGGMNAVHFGALAEEFFGIDISSASLEECHKQMSWAGLHNFRPVLIDAAKPEAAIDLMGGPCDLLISTYVFELLPTPEYGLRVLKIALEFLRPGGTAMIQIKYDEGNWKTRSKRWNYARNLAWNATYRIEEFWQAAEQIGLIPKMVKLLPRQPLVNDRNYAYYFLQKPSSDETATL
jgi:SAM-dependent methyltransferase